MADDPQKLAILVFDDAVDRVHYALIVAAAAAAINQQVTLFFAGQAVFALVDSVDDGTPGWHRLACSAAGQTAGQFDTTVQLRGAAGMETLIGSCRDLGVRFIVCEVASRLASLEPQELRGDLSIEIAGATTLLAGAERDGRILSF